MEYLDLLAENAQNWDTTGTYDALSKTQAHGQILYTHLSKINWFHDIICILRVLRYMIKSRSKSFSNTVGSYIGLPLGQGSIKLDFRFSRLLSTLLGVV